MSYNIILTKKYNTKWSMSIDYNYSDVYIIVYF